MAEGQEVLVLLELMFGENAALVGQTASERLLRWCQAMDDWLAERRQAYTDSTYTHSMTAWKRLLSGCGQVPWEIRPADIGEHIERLEAQGYNPKTIQCDLSALSRFYEWCKQREVEPTCGEGFNLVAAVNRPKVANYAKAEVLSRAEVRRLLALLVRDESNLGRRDYAFFLARLRMGVRSRWLQRLQWGQIERDEAEVRIHWQEERDGTACPQEVWEAVSAYLVASWRMKGLRPEDYIFAPMVDFVKREANDQPQAWDEERYLTSRQIHNSLKKYGRLAKIPEEKLRLPALRHTAVLLHREAGDILEEIHAFLGTGARLEQTRRYLKQLPELPPDEGRGLGEEQEAPALPNRRAVLFTSEDWFLHGLHARRQPAEEVQAILAQDIQGMEEEFAGLRMLSRRLFNAQTEAESDERAALLADTYTQAAARLGQISREERERGARSEDQSEEDQWVQDSLTILDNLWAEDLEELPSEQFWRELAESDSEMEATSRWLTEEIASIRLVLRNLYDLAMGTEEVKALVRYSDKYGQGCIRLTRLLKAM
jgi:site-specific recombinase XerD